MKIKSIILVLCLIFCISHLFGQTVKFAESEKLSIMFNRVAKGIVYCYSGGSKTTGIFVSRDGWILTAGHKVDKDFPGAHPIYVKLIRESDGKIFQSTQIIFPTPEWDLLLFKIDYKPKFYFKRFKRSYLFEENWVFGFRASSGKVPSSAGYVTFNMLYPHLFLTTASAVAGTSGSPVINRWGIVLGMIIKGYNFGDSFFIPSNIIKEYIEKNLK